MPLVRLQAIINNLKKPFTSALILNNDDATTWKSLIPSIYKFTTPYRSSRDSYIFRLFDRIDPLHLIHAGANYIHQRTPTSLPTISVTASTNNGPNNDTSDTIFSDLFVDKLNENIAETIGEH